MRVDDDPWRDLGLFTPARIALGRAGVSLPTAEVLAFALAHARARDAVHAGFDADALADALRVSSLSPLIVESDAPDRAAYLARPDRGRRLSAHSRLMLDALGRPGGDVAVIVGDGLSATAVAANARDVIMALRPRLAAIGLGLGPVVLAKLARVALGDEVGRLLAARSVVMLIGERPGLTSPDSLGAYITFAPGAGRTDADRNCVSNIRPDGISADLAAHKLAWLLAMAFRIGATGVTLKDESDTVALPGLSMQPVIGMDAGRSD